MKRNLTFLLLLVLSIVSCHSQEVVKKMAEVPDTTRLRIAFAGDMMGHMPVVNAAYVDSLKAYDYSPFFEYVRPYASDIDLGIVNLEVPLAGTPYSGYPEFSSPDALINGLKSIGFRVFMTANNHSLDRGKQGLERTVEILDSFKIQHTGTFRDSAEMRRLDPLIIEKNKIRLAILNYTYGTNGFKVQKPDIENYIDTAHIRWDIALSKSQNVDFIIVIFHWGNEYERLPTKEQRVIGEFVRKCGADAVIGSHPHVVQPVEVLRNVNDSTEYFPIVYSLGNFVSNQRDRYRDGGIIFELDLEKVKATRIKSFHYMPVWVYKGIINKKIGYRLIPPFMFDDAVRELNISEADQQKCRDFYNDTRAHLSNVPEMLK
jgi:poly-gamma-glutamate synthesis protein (capsule biosynthesis protein)